ncbi:MFS transporter [Pseudobacteriovorax antillogorgiicola]|uniref:Predicted arabinose efflux permease, MFS family n=1 Tax=Pseudobacteriovorax antillogorgiicola TaxID=1513793 RepID=A0A1Y6CNJ6_9BACT|nr:MFS transporter [Pseudobacteriovorax antillogorgiicola]TCS43614.1 putative MFS family arabinose efflux permease [Pseudobacteriovorax antillogorgiicola]SMF80062.1 Predicted arabinose efflux permease, MFS family [Pseudobacteriovorax antillogorgiicola]
MIQFIKAALILFGTAQAVQFILYPALAEALQLSISQVIGAYALGSFCFLFGGPFWALKSKQWGRLVAIRIGLVGQVLSLGATLWLMLRGNADSNGLLLLAIRIFYGLTASAIVPVSQAILADLSGQGKQRLRAMTTHSLMLNIGRLIGPLLVWGLLSIQLELFFGLLAILNLAVLGVSLRFSWESGVAELNSRGLSIDAQRFLGIPILALLLTTVVGIVQSSLGGLLELRFGLSPQESSHLLAQMIVASSLIMIVNQLALGRWAKKAEGWPLFGGVCGLLLATGFLLVAQNLILVFASIVLLGSSVAILVPAYTALHSQRIDADQGGAAASLSVSHTLGYGLGGLIAAIAFDWLPVASYWSALLVSLIGLLYLLFLDKSFSSQGAEHELPDIS